MDVLFGLNLTTDKRVPKGKYGFRMGEQLLRIEPIGSMAPGLEFDTLAFNPADYGRLSELLDEVNAIRDKLRDPNEGI